MIFWVAGVDANIWIGLRHSSVVIHQTNGSASRSAIFTSNMTLDGYWHTLMVSFDFSGLQVKTKKSGSSSLKSLC